MSASLPELTNCSIAVIGLGYVGLPLAVEFARCKLCKRSNSTLTRSIIGFDINQKRLQELKNGYDRTKEIHPDELKIVDGLVFTDDINALTKVDVFIITVPTPIDSAKRPDLSPIERASATVGRVLKNRDSTNKPIVVYESTVYPGATEEFCVPILERESGLSFNKDFFCGYSPERINPGDKEHTLTSISKVTSGSNEEVGKWIDSLYGSIIHAGTYLAPSIKVAEAAKVIENTQRDLNIALINELSVIFSKMKIDTIDVLKAAGTKWNFLPFRPGLVGGHCIGVDPYYLTYKAEQLGYHPEVVLAGRRINDSMASWVAQQLVLGMAKKKLQLVGAKVLLLGFSFKENCPDFRNTKVVDLFLALEQFGLEVTVIDPHVDSKEVFLEHEINIGSTLPNETYEAVILAVSHDEFRKLELEQWSGLTIDNGVFLDLKDTVPRDLNPIRI